MLKKKLKLALKKAGLDEALADHITVKKESEIAGVIAALKSSLGGDDDDDDDPVNPEDFLSSDDFASYLEENGLDAIFKKNKKLKSLFDSKVTKGIETFKKKALGKTDDDSGDDADDDDDDPLKGATPFQKLMWKKLEKLEKQNAEGERVGKAEKAIEKSRLPKAVKKKWVTRLDPESDESLEDQVKALEEEYKSIHADAIGKETYEFPDSNDDDEAGKGKGNNGELSKEDRKSLEEMAKKL